ncbi:alpha/beta hydrolase [Cognatishimia sp. MH4019]|uniref:alpha/beta hydrolase n=1 Tax=Cognatishimia sp. MH4019 TaxID=2854030 RepID=UPI001CD19E98|nr:alpha/beta hydrolase [Cognatishimia sp. MH4019]
MAELVFADDRLRATLHALDARRLVVTFDNRKLGKADFEPRDPARNFLNAGFAQLHIETKANDWFINASTPALEVALAKLRGRFHQVKAIGFSMGGYGALRLSGALGIDEVALISAQISIDRAVVPFETRYKREAKRFSAETGALDSANPNLGGVICYDPFHRLDSAHAALIAAAFPKIKRVPMALGQHPATNILREQRAIGKVQKQVVQGFDAVALKADHRAACRITALYWERLAEKAAPRHPDWARQAQQRAKQIHAENP